MEPEGWVCDFQEISDAWAPLHAELDHRYLNEIAGLENPTSELLAAWIWERASAGTPGAVRRGGRGNVHKPLSL